MTVEHLELLVEEPSMEAALRALLPRMLAPSVTYSIHVMGGKQRLLRHLESRLRGYSAWLPPSWRVVVLVDRDRDDCRELKDRLEHMATRAGMATTDAGTDWRVANRIVVEELESWFLGDALALHNAYPRLPATLGESARFRDPDAVANACERLEKELQKCGYFRAGLAKVELARRVAPHMQPGRNRSHSFQVFHRTLVDCVSQP